MLFRSWLYNPNDELFVILRGDHFNEGTLSKDEHISRIHPEDLDGFWNTLNALSDGREDRGTVKFRFMIDNQWHWFQCSLMASYNNNNERFITGIRKDITEEVIAKKAIEQKHLELQNSEERLNTILNKLPIPVYIIDPDTRVVTSINEAAVNLFGSGSYAFSKEFIIPEDVEAHAAVDKHVITSNEEYIANEVLRLKNGKELNTYVRKSLLELNGKKHILVMRMDLTEQYRAKMANKILSVSLPSFKA